MKSVLTEPINQLFKKSYAFREKAYLPLLVRLARYGIKPHHITLFRLILSLPLIYYFWRFSLAGVVTTLVFNWLLDTFDGSLARHLKISSDRGKFLDIVVDQFTYCLTALGLIYWQVVSPVIMGFFILISFFSYLVAIIDKQETRQSDWLIKPQADMTPTKLASIVLVALIIFGYNFLDPGILILDIWLSVLFIHHFYSIIQRWYGSAKN